MASKSSWAGWIVFASFVIIIVGVMDVLQGFIAILEDEYVVATPKGLAIFGVAINAIQQVAFLANYPQAYPLWNILIVALNFVVLFALTVRWEGYNETMRGSTA